VGQLCQGGDVTAAGSAAGLPGGEVTRLFEAYQGKRGSPVITADLRDDGWRVSENTVAALTACCGTTTPEPAGFDPVAVAQQRRFVGAGRAHRSGPGRRRN
jgi:hypothetical protein